MSEDAIDLVKAMMNRDVNQRVSCKQALQHKWFVNAPSKQVRDDLMGQSLTNLFSFNAK